MGKCRKVMLFTFLVLSLVFLSGSLFKAHATGNITYPVINDPNRTVWINPPQTENDGIGSNLTIYIQIDNADGIMGVQAQFTFDSTIFGAPKVAEGPFLQSFGQTLAAISVKNVSDTLGEIDVNIALEMGTAGGSGILANVTFTVVSAGGSSRFNLIPFTSQNVVGVPGTYLEELTDPLDPWNSQVYIVPKLANGFFGSPISFEAFPPTAVTIGDSVTLNGTVSGSSVANVTEIGLQYKSLSMPGASWIDFANVSVDASHNFSIQWMTNVTGAFVFEASYSAGNHTHSSPIVEVVVVPSIHGYGLYVAYAFIGLIVFIAALSIILSIRTHRKNAAEKPPT